MGDATTRYERSLRRVEAARPPQFGAGGRVVPGGVVAAGDDQFLLPAVAQDGGRRVRVRRLRDRIGRALDTPERLAGGGVDGQHVRRVVGLHPVQHLDVEPVADQQRRRGVAPVEAERAVVLLDVARPQLAPGEVERLQDAGARHHPHALAVGDGRRRRHVLLAHLDVAAAERLLPQLDALLPVHAQQIQLRSVADVQEDPIAPDDRRRTGELGQRQLPRDVLRGAPRGREVLRHRDAGHLGTAPVGPVGAGLRGRALRDEQSDHDDVCSKHAAAHFPKQ